MTIREKIDALVSMAKEREILIKESKTVEEVELLKKMLQYTRDVYGNDSNSTIKMLNELGGTSKYIGEYDLGIKCLKEALDIIEKKFGIDSISYATTTLNLTEVYRFKGEIEKLENLYKSVIKIYGSYKMENSYEYASVCNNLGLYYQDTNNPSKALPLHLTSLEILKNMPDYPVALATTYNNLAIAYRMLGENEKSDECIKTCLDIYEKEVGKGHAMYSAAINNLAVAFYNKGELEKSLELFKKVLFICEASFGRGSVNYEKVKSNVDMVKETIEMRKKK